MIGLPSLIFCIFEKLLEKVLLSYLDTIFTFVSTSK